MTRRKGAADPTLCMRWVACASFFLFLQSCSSASNAPIKSASKNQDSEPRVVLIAPPLSQAAPEICRNAWDDNGNRLLDEGCDQEQSALTVAIFWSEARADFDLWVTGPDQQVARLDEVTSSGLYKTADCPEKGPTRDHLQPCDELLESVKLDELKVPSGSYRIEIVLEKFEQTLNEELPVSLGIISPDLNKNFQIFFTPERLRFEMIFDVRQASEK